MKEEGREGGVERGWKVEAGRRQERKEDVRVRDGSGKEVFLNVYMFSWPSRDCKHSDSHLTVRPRNVGGTG